jgi:hypothetical protein
MDFDALARATGYRPYTTEFDRLDDIRTDHSAEFLSSVAARVETYRPVYSDFDPGPDPASDAHFLAERMGRLGADIDKLIDGSGIDPAQTTIAFLVDTSGSVRMRASQYARVLDRIVEGLDARGFDTPVVGHSTVLWKGGRSRERWIEAGRPRDPGRLNDLLLTIYKQPGQPHREGDVRLYGLALSKRYKENLDGEALMWLARALDRTDRPHRIIVNLTDGARCADDSTLASNARSALLDEFRIGVIAEIEGKSDIVVSTAIVSDGSNTRLDDQIADITFPVRSGGIAGSQADVVDTLIEAIGKGLRLALEKKPSQPRRCRTA